METTKKVWFYDTEQFSNFHCATFINRDNPQDVRTFVIYENRNDCFAYYRFLKDEVAGLIGFNNVNYDYPLLHFFMAIMQSYAISNSPNAYNLNRLLYEESNRLITAEYSAIYESDTLIPQLDLYRIHHFDNKAKATSLKALEIVMKLENVLDMPIEPDEYVEDDLVDQIINYNINDVRATGQFYLLTTDMIEMRKKLGNRYNLNLRNANDPKIGQEIFGHEIAKKKGWSYKYLKDLRTYRHFIDLKECILPYITFQSREFNNLLDELKTTVIETTYKAFEKSVIYKGFKYDYGTGGIHGCIKSGIYEEDNNYIIVDIDVKSYYPNLAIINQFYPQHLGFEFVEVYEELFKQRIQAQIEKDNATNSGLKLALNGTFGKSNDKFSLFYDPKYFIKITINGQLLLTFLAETLVNTITDLTMLQINTDGITVRIRKGDHEKLLELCKKWEVTTQLKLEYQQYKKMVIRDVNNYYAIDSNGKGKYKGCFEIIPMQNGAIAYNKDWSMRVVPKALEAYYKQGIPIEDFIRNHDDIYDFCIGFRARAGWTIYRNYINTDLRIISSEKQQKTIRYYISNNGSSLIKQDEEGHIIQLNAGFASTMFNMYEKKDMKDYNIDYDFYIAEANKVKYAVYDGQLNLF